MTSITRQRFRLVTIIVYIIILIFQLNNYMEKRIKKEVQETVKNQIITQEVNSDPFVYTEEPEKKYEGSKLSIADSVVIADICKELDIDADMILAAILTNTNGDVSHGRGLFNMSDMPAPYILEDVFVMELKRFLLFGGYYTQDDFNRQRFIPRVSFLKCYINVYGSESLTPLYNNYNRITGTTFK